MTFAQAGKSLGVEPFTMPLTCFHDRTRHPFS